jgi:hypothetical protein
MKTCCSFNNDQSGSWPTSQENRRICKTRAYRVSRWTRLGYAWNSNRIMSSKWVWNVNNYYSQVTETFRHKLAHSLISHVISFNALNQYKQERFIAQLPEIRKRASESLPLGPYAISRLGSSTKEKMLPKPHYFHISHGTAATHAKSKLTPCECWYPSHEIHNK